MIFYLLKIILIRIIKMSKLENDNINGNEKEYISSNINDANINTTIDTGANNEYIKETNKSFYSFLQNHRIYGDGVEYTHTCFGPPLGKYFIDDGLEYEKFLVLYKRILEAGVIGYGGLYVTEKQKKVGPLYVDYDFRFEEKKRQYSQKNIEEIGRVYMNIIKKYIDIKDIDELKAYVTEKQKPTFDEKQNNYKDGFHIIFPLPIDVSIRFLIHEEAKEEIRKSNILADVHYLNDFDDVVDESVIIRNGWLMYGSKKENKTPYMLTKVYDSNMNNLEKNTYSKDELAVLFSARRHDEDEPLELKEEFNTVAMKQNIKTIYEKYNLTKKQKSNQKSNILKQERINNYLQPTVNVNNPDVQMAKKLITILSDKRADKYNEWATVGWALYNIDAGLYDEFIEFSKKCKNKFSEDGCHKFWNSSKSGGYTIASLHFWAKHDNPVEYENILLESINKIIENAETGNHDDLAKVLFEMYKYEYKCVSKTKNKWYAFYKNRWHFVDQAYTLSNIISDVLAVIFGKRAINYFNKASFGQGGDRDNCSQKGVMLMKIVEKLKTESFKNSVIASAASRFIDEKFEEKLDSNPNLLGFENGVYDLENGIFRKGIPEDYMLLSTGYDYNPNYTIKSKEIIDIIKYFDQVMTEVDMKEYTLESFASFLDGHIKQQVFRVFTGSGGNAKSQTMDLLKATMGQYFGVLPTGVLTRKRGSSSGATPELADKRGKRYLVIQEPEHDDVIYVGQMKNITGGDTIMARALYGDPFEYKPQWKLGLICNKLPNLPSTDGGTSRRLKVIPFESEFVSKVDPKKLRQFKVDPSLCERMKVWSAPFMWLLLNIYYNKYRGNNYTINEPAKVTTFTDNYKRDSDKYYEFISQYIVVTNDDNDTISIISLYSTFRNWHTESGYGRNIPNKREFANHIISNKNFTIDSDNFVGICYKDDYDEREKNKKNKQEKKPKINNKIKEESDSDNESESDNDNDNDNDNNNDNKSKEETDEFTLDD
jgi:P4 family phage/plasmid primase-like protien